MITKYNNIVSDLEEKLKNINVSFADQILVVDGSTTTNVSGDLRSLILSQALQILSSDQHDVLGENHKEWVAESFKDIYVERNGAIIVFHVERKEQ